MPHEASQERAEEVSGFFNQEGALEFATHFPGKPYVDTVGTRFSEILRKESMAVVKSSYFEKQFREQQPYQDRASIDPASFFSGEEVLKQWQEYGARFLMIVSYSWLSREHPDPELFHLKRLSDNTNPCTSSLTCGLYHEQDSRSAWMLE